MHGFSTICYYFYSNLTLFVLAHDVNGMYFKSSNQKYSMYFMYWLFPITKANTYYNFIRVNYKILCCGINQTHSLYFNFLLSTPPDEQHVYECIFMYCLLHITKVHIYYNFKSLDYKIIVFENPERTENRSLVGCSFQNS